MQHAIGVMRRAGDRMNAFDLDLRGGGEPAQHPIERIGPHHRRGRQIAVRRRRTPPVVP